MVALLELDILGHGGALIVTRRRSRTDDQTLIEATIVALYRGDVHALPGRVAAHGSQNGARGTEIRAVYDCAIRRREENRDPGHFENRVEHARNQCVIRANV
jgi:hypothetical protein